MGVDPALPDGYPSVLIFGSKYHYGQDPEYGQWMVSHESDGKRYWCFETRQKMVDFLENLPDSAEQPVVNGRPMWLIAGLITDEEREKVWADHRKQLRRLLKEKRRKRRTFRYERGGE